MGMQLTIRVFFCIIGRTKYINLHPLSLPYIEVSGYNNISNLQSMERRSLATWTTISQSVSQSVMERQLGVSLVLTLTLTCLAPAWTFSTQNCSHQDLQESQVLCKKKYFLLMVSELLAFFTISISSHKLNKINLFCSNSSVVFAGSL